MLKARAKAVYESFKVFCGSCLVPLFKHAGKEFQPFLGDRWRSSVAIFVGSSVCGVLVRLWIIGSPTDVVMSELVSFIVYGIAANCIVFLSIFGVLFLCAPFKIHYEKLRAACPDYWLHGIAEQDTDNLHESLALELVQVEMYDSPKTGPYLRFSFRLFNGSVYCLKCEGIAGKTPYLVDHDSQEQIPLPKPELAYHTINDLHHAKSGEVSIHIKLTEKLTNRVREIASRQINRRGEHHNSGYFDLRNVLIEVTTKETNEVHRFALPTVDMGTVKRIGLEHSMSVLEEKNDA